MEITQLDSGTGAAPVANQNATHLFDAAYSTLVSSDGRITDFIDAGSVNIYGVGTNVSRCLTAAKEIEINERNNLLRVSVNLNGSFSYQWPCAVF